MAEERILIQKDCDVCGEPNCQRCFSKNEAVEKMARAIFLQIYPGEETDVVDLCSDYKNMAEAALNALLEEGK